MMNETVSTEPNHRQAEAASGLFERVTLCGMDLPSRIALAPMTRGFATSGLPRPAHAAYYGRRAANGVGLIITEGTYVSPDAGTNPGVPHFFGEPAIEGWRETVEWVHRQGGRIAPQLWHTGTLGRRYDNPLPAAGPSGLAWVPTDSGPEFRVVGEPMTLEDIEATIDAFGQAARKAMLAGFDAIELHGAHGYLIDQFLWDKTNRRTDRYGGTSIEARSKFAADVVRACRIATRPDYPIILRFSQWKIADYEALLFRSQDELATFLSAMSEAGVDVFHCSTRRYWTPAFPGTSETLAGLTRRLSGKPVIAVGSVGLDHPHEAGGLPTAPTHAVPIEQAADMLRQGAFDLLAVGRALLADPCWAAKLRDGRNDFVPFTNESRRTFF